MDILNTSPNLGISVNTDIRLDFLEEQQQKELVYQDIFGAVRLGVKLDALDSSHPVKALRLEFLELQLIKGRQLITYQGKVYVPNPVVNDVIKFLHKGHIGVNRCLEMEKQTMFWPTMARETLHYKQ